MKQIFNLNELNGKLLLKMLAGIVLPLVILSIVVPGFLIFDQYKMTLLKIRLEQEKTIDLQSSNLQNDLKSVHSDLNFVKNLLEDFILQSPEDIAILNIIFKQFSSERKFYDQIRYIDYTGMEKIRINYKNGKAVTVAPSDLQDKSKRNYVIKGLALGKADIYISPFDLNVESGKLEQPLKPVIRYATPVFDKNNKKTGIAVLNYKGEQLLKNIRRTSPEVFLLNSNGYFLYSPKPGDCWGWQLEDRKNKNFQQMFPKAWKAITASTKGTIITDSGMFTFVSIDPDASVLCRSQAQPKNKQCDWKLVCLYSREKMSELQKFYWLRYLYIAGSIFLVVVITSMLLILFIMTRKNAEKEINKLSRAIEYAPIMIVLADSDYNIEYVNPKFQEITGYSKNDAIGHKISEVIASGDQSFIPEEITNDIRNGEIWSSERMNRRKDGENIWLRIFIAPILNNRLQLSSLVLVAEDITEQKKNHQMLEDTKERAEIATRVKNQFLANMSHEIRTPMNAIMGFSEILDSQITEKSLKEFISAIRSSGRSLLELIDDILDLSRIEAGTMAFEYSNANTENVLNEVVRKVSEKIKSKDIKISLDINQNVPPFLVLDKYRFIKILSNLIFNILKMTEHGTIEIRLKALNRTESNTTLDIVICDSGFDMEEAEKNKIFGAFDIHNHAPKSFGAAGLEFSITKKMIEMMNGTIAFRKHEPHGAVFRLLFKKVGVPDDAAIPKQNVKEIKDVTFSPATIIVADDVMTNRKLLAKYISRFSELTVAEAEDGEALLQLAEQLNPALIFTDIHMPGLSGYDAMKSLKQNKQLSSIIIIAVTASSFEEIHEDIEKYCDAYLRKPINGQELLKILIKYLPHDDPQTESQPPLPATTPGFAADNFENYGKNLPELADILDKDFKERVSSTADLLIINEIESLGLDLEKIGRQYDSPPVIDWAEKLIAEANMFDIQNLPETLAKFDDILNVIRRKAENTGE